MVRMITIPVLVLFTFVIYFFFEVPILKTMAWATGDGMVNAFVIYRLEENNQLPAIVELTRGHHAKARLFALASSHQRNLEEGLKAIPQLVMDPSWEVRMEAIQIATARRYGGAGRSIIQRLESGDSLGEEKQRWHFEREALFKSLMAVAAPENAESMAQLALTTGDRGLANEARKALWQLGPLPQAEQVYRELLRAPEEYRVVVEDTAACLRAAAVLGLPGALEKLLLHAREGSSYLRTQALKSLGDLGGDAAKTYLKTVADAPAWKLTTQQAKTMQRVAVRALERIRLREAGEPDISAEPEEEEPEAPAKVAGGEPSVDDLLASYGSSGPTSGP